MAGSEAMHSAEPSELEVDKLAGAPLFLHGFGMSAEQLSQLNQASLLFLFVYT